MPRINTAEITQDDIKKADTSDLVELYNEISGKSIKKFSSRATGEKQVWKLIGQLAPGENIWNSKHKTSDKPAKTNGDKPKASKKREIYENKTLKVNATENPKRPGSHAFDKFAVIMKMDGRTVKDLKSQEGKHPKLDTEKGWPATELRWAVRLGLVKLVNGN